MNNSNDGFKNYKIIKDEQNSDYKKAIEQSTFNKTILSDENALLNKLNEMNIVDYSTTEYFRLNQTQFKNVIHGEWIQINLEKPLIINGFTLFYKRDNLQLNSDKVVLLGSDDNYDWFEVEEFTITPNDYLSINDLNSYERKIGHTSLIKDWNYSNSNVKVVLKYLNKKITFKNFRFVFKQVFEKS